MPANIYYHIVYRVQKRYTSNGMIWDNLVRVGNILYADKDKLLAGQQITYLAWKHKCPKSYYRIVRVNWKRGQKYESWPRMYVTAKHLYDAETELGQADYPKMYRDLLIDFPKVENE